MGEGDGEHEGGEEYDPGVAKTQRMLRDPVTYAIIGAAQKVHRTLGPGFAESTYQRALAKELADMKVAFASQPEYEVFYEGAHCGTYRPDMVVAEHVVIELKAVSGISGDHIAQTISYMKASRLPKALLINFGGRSLEWRRFQN